MYVYVYDRIELTRFEILRIPPVARKWTPPCPGKIRSLRPCTAAGPRRPTETRKRDGKISTMMRCGHTTVASR